MAKGVIQNPYLKDCQEAIKFIRQYDLDAERTATKFKFHELDALAKYLGFKTTGKKELELAELVLKAVK